MRFAKYLGAVAALSMATAPAMAAPVNPAASLSVLSHLIKLVKEERVSADPEPTMAARYRLID